MRVDQEAQYLQWENLYLRTLAEGASEGFCVLRQGLVIAYVNPPIEWFVRLTAPEIIGTRIDEFIAPEEREQARSLLSGLLARPGQSRATEVPFRRWDGRLRDVSLKIRSHPGSAENETFLTINAADISFRKEVEKRLVSLGELKPGAVNSSQANIDMIVSEARMLENDDLIVYIRGGPGEAKSFGSGSAASGRYEEFASSPVFLENPVDCQEGPATFHDPEPSSMDQPLLAEAAKYGLSCVTVFPVNFNGDIIGTLYAFGRPRSVTAQAGSGFLITFHGRS